MMLVVLTGLTYHRGNQIAASDPWCESPPLRPVFDHWQEYGHDDDDDDGGDDDDDDDDDDDGGDDDDDDDDAGSSWPLSQHRWWFLPLFMATVSLLTFHDDKISNQISGELDCGELLTPESPPLLVTAF